MDQLRADPEATPSARLERAVLTLIEVGRRQPHLYALMFSTPADDSEAAEAASREGRCSLEGAATMHRTPRPVRNRASPYPVGPAS